MPNALGARVRHDLRLLPGAVRVTQTGAASLSVRLSLFGFGDVAGGEGEGEDVLGVARTARISTGAVHTRQDAVRETFKVGLKEVLYLGTVLRLGAWGSCVQGSLL